MRIEHISRVEKPYTIVVLYNEVPLKEDSTL